MLKKIPFAVSLKQKLFPNPLSKFLQGYFAQQEGKTIIQVGANDGVMSDPLRPYLVEPGNYRATLVEPIPYYIDKLRDLYRGRSDIDIVRAALGSECKTEKLFFIPPPVADSMNGEGPHNNWAHGQGSFDKKSIVYWIEQNRFRGEAYCAKVPDFIASITCLDTPVRQVRELSSAGEKNLLLLIDVQGFELEVLKGVDWDNPPAHVIYEDDRDAAAENIATYLRDRGYVYVAGNTDKIYSYKSAPEFW